MFTIPPQLLTVNRIELCQLRDSKQSTIDHPPFAAGHGFGIVQKYWLAELDRTRVIDWWNQLGNGEVARCHLPAFGLYFYQDEMLLASASVCWGCNNIYFAQQQPQEFYCFDGASIESQQVLALFQKSFPAQL